MTRIDRAAVVLFGVLLVAWFLLWGFTGGFWGFLLPPAIATGLVWLLLRGYLWVMGSKA